MFPPLRQRLLVVVSIVVGGLAWSLSADSLRATDGSAGLTLIDAGLGIPVTAMLFIVPGIPALLLGLVVSVVGTAATGLFVVASALSVLAAFGGGLDHWLRGPNPPLSTRFLVQVFEMGLWGVGIALVMALYMRTGEMIRQWADGDGPDGVEKDIPGRLWSGMIGLGGRRMEETLRGILKDAASSRTSQNVAASVAATSTGQAILAGGVSALVAGILAFLLIRSPDTGQIFWSLVVAFLVGGLAGRLAVPGCSPWGIVVSPAVVGVLGYFWALFLYGNDHEAYLAALFSTEQTLAAVPGIALALPIHYASAGVVGATLGIGWARHFAATARHPL